MGGWLSRRVNQSPPFHHHPPTHPPPQPQKDIAFFDANQSGELTNRLTADCSKISNVVSLNVNIMLRQTIQLVGGLVYLYRLHRSMALVAGGGLAFIFLVTGIHGKYNRALGR